MPKKQQNKKISKSISRKLSSSDKRISLLRKTLIVSAGLLLLTTAVSPIAKYNSNKAEAYTAKTALVMGDSLTFESRYAIANQFKLKIGWTQYIHAFPGFAVCDFLTWLPQDLALYQPSIVSLETAGNTRPCMVDANGAQITAGSPEYFAKYTADFDAFFAQVTATGAKVLLVQAPPFQNTIQNGYITQLNNIAKVEAAKYHGVSVSAVPRNAVSFSGQYVAYKTCLASETPTMGCGVDGKIAIRTITGIQTGVHFCPSGLNAAYPFDCPDIYSSGEYRFGKSIANTLVAPPAPLLP